MSFFKKLFNQKGKMQDNVSEENNDTLAQSEKVQNEDIQLDEMIEESNEIDAEIEEEVEDITEIAQDNNQTEQDIAQLEGKEADKVEKKKTGLFSKLVQGLTKTRNNILEGVDNVLRSFTKIDEELYEELEEALIMADIGVNTTMEIMMELREKVKENKVSEPSQLKELIVNIIAGKISTGNHELNIEPGTPTVILVIGVNGVGKTTTIGKLANQLKQQHKKVIIGAADTFRAAAIEQLEVWGERSGVDVIKHHEGADPAAVIYDALQAAKARKTDILICDTAGRLHNKTNLMKELEKIFKVIEREFPQANKEVLLVLDATTGQNAVQQVKLFKEVAEISGIVLTKLDGTAKGGIIIGIHSSMGIPVKFIGVGEGIDDLQPFNPEEFSKALFYN